MWIHSLITTLDRVSVLKIHEGTSSKGKTRENKHDVDFLMLADTPHGRAL